MKIEGTHVNRMWASILEHRDASQHGASSGQSQSSSQSSVTSALSGFSPGHFEVTRYSFKHTFALHGNTPKCEPNVHGN